MSLEAVLLKTNTLLAQLLVAMGAADNNQAEELGAAMTGEAIPADKETAQTLSLSYQDTAVWVMKVVEQMGKDKALTILEGFGLANLKQALPEQYAEIVAACQKALQESSCA